METDRIAQAKAAALARFTDNSPNHINCAQAVLAYALDVLGEDPALVTVAAYFGGGVASMGEICGAIAGAAMAAGMRDYSSGGPDPLRAAATKEALQTAMKDFGEEFGSCRCRDLTGYDVSTPEGFKAFKESEAKEKCPVFVGWMMDEIAPLLED